MINYDRDKLYEALKQAYANAWRYRPLQYKVFLFDDGDIVTTESVSGDNSYYRNARLVHSFCNNAADVWECAGGTYGDLIATMSEDERETVKAMRDEDVDADEWTYRLNDEQMRYIDSTEAAAVYNNELLNWLADEDESIDYAIDAILDELDEQMEREDEQ